MQRDEVWYSGKTLIRIKAVSSTDRQFAIFTHPIDREKHPMNEITARTLEYFIKKTQDFEIKRTLFDNMKLTEEDRFFTALLSGTTDVSVMVESDVNLTHIAHYFVTWARNYSPLWGA